MRKKFTRKPQRDEPATPSKNYITPSGLQRLKDEHRFLLTRERPAVTEVVAWAASNGDRSHSKGKLHAQTSSQCPCIYLLLWK
jgi:transcription elongation factor GreB